VSGRKHNNIKIDSFEPISLFFLSADAAAHRYVAHLLKKEKQNISHPDNNRE